MWVMTVEVLYLQNRALCFLLSLLLVPCTLWSHRRNRHGGSEKQTNNIYFTEQLRLLIFIYWYRSIGLTIFYSGIKYTEDWVWLKVWHYPICRSINSIPICSLYLLHSKSELVHVRIASGQEMCTDWTIFMFSTLLIITYIVMYKSRGVGYL